MTSREDTLNHIKNEFERIFPGWAERLNNAQTDEEVSSIINEFLIELSPVSYANSGSGPSNEGALAITGPAFDKLNQLKGGSDDIKADCDFLLNLPNQLSQLPKNPTDEQIVALFNQYLTAALGTQMTFKLQDKLSQLEGKYSKKVIDALLMAFIKDPEFDEVIGPLVALFSVVLPILYFMAKPAQCVLYLLNDTNENIKYLHRHGEHGKCLAYAQNMLAKVENQTDDEEVGTIRFGGLFSTSKDDGALIGTQYGFSFTINDPITDDELNSFSVGISCPLTEDNCFSCAFDASEYSAERISKDPSTKHGHEQIKTDSGYQLKIVLNSFGHSPAYFVAILSKTS